MKSGWRGNTHHKQQHGDIQNHEQLHFDHNRHRSPLIDQDRHKQPPIDHRMVLNHLANHPGAPDAVERLSVKKGLQ